MSNLADKLKFLDTRKKFLLDGIDIRNKSKSYLEIAPNWAPLLIKQETNVDYCDRIGFDELVEREKNNEGMLEKGLNVQPLDFIWADGLRLKDCVQKDCTYDVIVSSHVVEHVPNFLDWLYQQREVLKDDGVILLVIPNAMESGEYIRPLSTIAQVIDSWILKYEKPAAWQVYEGLTRITEWNGHREDKPLEQLKRWYTEKEALDAAFRSLRDYIDIHCWAFTPDTFLNICSELKKSNLWHFDVRIVDNLDGVSAVGEFYVQLRPTGTIDEIPRVEGAIQRDEKYNFVSKLSKRFGFHSLKQNW